MTMSSHRAPSIEDISNACWLRTDLQGGPEWAHLLTMFAIKCHSMMGHGRRPDALDKTREAFGVLLPNLYRSYQIDPYQYVIVDKSTHAYAQSPYNPIIGSRGLIRAVDFLVEGKYVEKRAGNFNKINNSGLSTRIRATNDLIDRIDHWLSRSISPTDGSTFPITNNTFTADPHSINGYSHLKVLDLPVIRMKPDDKNEDARGRYIKFGETAATQAMRENLLRINTFIADHWIDLFIPDEQLLQLAKSQSGRVDIAGRRTLYRVFNNNSFDQGGRFYGGWWQDVPAGLRQFVTINWHTTAELDYSSAQASMLYAMEGLKAPVDSYALPDFPIQYRKVLKTAFFKLVNATGRMAPVPTKDLPPNWTWAKIIKELEALHHPIKQHFRTGVGIKLQRLDADIAERVMLTLMDEGIVALPVHDSFIVIDNKQDRLREVMSKAYFDVMKQEIGVKADTIWTEKMIPPEADELQALGVRFRDDFQADIERRPEYARYRGRRDDFLRVMGEGWGHRHSFFS